jgi:hypothetical protein
MNDQYQMDQCLFRNACRLYSLDQLNRRNEGI